MAAKWVKIDEEPSIAIFQGLFENNPNLDYGKCDDLLSDASRISNFR